MIKNGGIPENRRKNKSEVDADPNHMVFNLSLLKNKTEKEDDSMWSGSPSGTIDWFFADE